MAGKGGPFPQLVANRLDKYGITLTSGSNVLDVLKATSFLAITACMISARTSCILSSAPHIPTSSNTKERLIGCRSNGWLRRRAWKAM